MPLSTIGTVISSAIGLAPIAGPSGGATSTISRLGQAVVAIMSLAFAFLCHVGAFGWHPDPFIDLVASVAVGVVFGRGVGAQEATSAVAAQQAEAMRIYSGLVMSAHERLNKIGAPPAPLDGTAVEVGAPAS